MDIKDFILKHEGLSLKVYKDSVGKLTIGVGRNLDDRGLSYSEAMMLFENDILQAEKDLYDIFGNAFFEFPENIKIALTDMMFNLGKTKFFKF